MSQYIVIILCRLAALGSKCITPRVDVDLEDWPVINAWMDSLLESLASLELNTSSDYLDLSVMEEETGHSRTRPFMAEMTVSTTTHSCIHIHRSNLN